MPVAPALTQPRGTDQLPPTPAQTQAGGPRLVTRDGKQISLPRGGNEVIVGREDPISGIHPEVDLTPHGGESGGVSRRHAVLREQNGQWSVTDLDSTNYTRVDGTRIAPNTPTPLHNGARVQFGRVELEFFTA
jgi:pSer/pThr/pTyr-binding forkhead associated (FHA) protein